MERERELRVQIIACLQIFLKNKLLILFNDHDELRTF
jgi:hypothetical protein